MQPRQMLPAAVRGGARGRPVTLNRGLEWTLTKGPLSRRGWSGPSRARGREFAQLWLRANMYSGLTRARGSGIKPDTFQISAPWLWHGPQRSGPRHAHACSLALAHALAL